MRLTLRTLLAYLDDTLAPSAAKELGAKLAESEAAQEIVERIKNVIRRRRLTVAPAASRIDPNTIAEYLENELSPEQAEELERICLASDVHLAEVAACHQILTLILGEPAEVPEAVIKRMYELGKGMPVRPPRRPRTAPAVEKTASADADADQALPMGLPNLTATTLRSRMMILAGATAAALLLAVAIWQLMHTPVVPVEPSLPSSDKVAQADSKKPEQPPGGPEIQKVPPTKDTKTPESPPTPSPLPPPVATPPVKPIPAPPQPAPEPAKSTEPDLPPAKFELPPPMFSGPPEGKGKHKLADVPSGPASTAVVAVGTVAEAVKDPPTVLLQQLPKTGEWVRVPSGIGKMPEVLSARPLVSLPGSKAVLVLGTKVRLTLWGNLPEQIPSPPLQESRVELHAPSVVDADLTLRRGRILLTSTRDDGPVLVRVRFENSSDLAGAEASWLVSLQNKGSEVMIDRFGFIPGGEPFYRDRDNPDRKGPDAFMAAIAVHGTVTLKTPTETATLQAPPNQNLAMSYSRAPKLTLQSMPALEWLSPKAKIAAKFTKTRQDIDLGFGDKAVDVALAGLLKSTDPLGLRTAVRCLGAIDDLSGLVDMLNQDKADSRTAAVETLYFWIAASRDNDYRLYDLLKQRYKFSDAETILILLHGFSEQAAQRPETYALLIQYLVHNQMAIRELAAWNLNRLAPGAKVPYDAADSAKREAGYRQWLKLVPAGNVPTPAMKKVSLQRNVAASFQLAAVSDLPTLRTNGDAGPHAYPRNHLMSWWPFANSRSDAAATTSS